MYCINLSNDESTFFMYYFLSDSQSSFSSFWRTEYAISDHWSTGLFKSKIFDVLGLGLEKFAKTTNFSL